MWVYCRECNRAFLVVDQDAFSYIERSDEYGLKAHPKRKCDRIIPDNPNNSEGGGG